MFAALAFATTLTAEVTRANTYQFDYESFDAALAVKGHFAVNAADETISVSGEVSGLVDQTISGIIANPNFPGAAYSPDGSFIYNDKFYASGLAFDIDGLLFTTAQNPGGYWNLWGNSPGDYSLYESTGSYNYPIQSTGTLSVAAAPEPSTWAMLGLGFSSLGVVGRRRSGRRLEERLV
jgi:hypothetical protein